VTRGFKNPGRGFGEPERIDRGVSSDARSDPRLARELEDREQLIWAGRPQAKLMGFRSIPLMIFGIGWTAFSVFWILAASGVLLGRIGGGGQIIQVIFSLFGVPFVVIGLFMLSSPYWARRSARRTLYALTDQRCIIWLPKLGSGMTVKSYRPDDLGSMSRVERKDGSGDVIFVKSIRIRERTSSSDTVTEAEGFMAVEDAHTLERLIRDTLLSEFSVPGETQY
jgi:hypothetical protein